MSCCPFPFSPGEYDVPDQAADFFIRAGWASLPGQQPEVPDKTKPVFVQPDNVLMSSKGGAING